jgi:hypothetical protein
MLDVVNDQVKIQGVTPSDMSEFYNLYDRTLTIRNAIDYMDWLNANQRLQNNEIESLTLMLNSGDIEDFNLALVIIKNK